MTALAILTSPQLAIPKDRQVDDYEAFAGGVLDEFLNTIRGMAGQDRLADSIKAELPKMTALSTSLKDVLHIYFAGNTYEAYQRFVGLLPPILADLRKLMSAPGGVADLHVMYRIRKSSLQQLRPQDIFHLPFELRHEATMKRYSVPGIPMLYLGGSLYICWEEMGRPSFDEIQISAFWTRDGVTPKLLDFGYRPSWLSQFVHNPSGMARPMQEFVTSYCVVWPLMAMCSIKAMRAGKPFVPEYVFPQMVLQWLTVTHEFDGIRYWSCHMDRDTDAPSHMCNFVFPPKQCPASGLSPDLEAMFDWTAPLPWQMLDAVRPPSIDPKCYPSFSFALYPGAVSDYRRTAFGEVQARLNQAVVHKHPSILRRAQHF